MKHHPAHLSAYVSPIGLILIARPGQPLQVHASQDRPTPAKPQKKGL